MPSSIYANGQQIFVPGVYTTTNTSALTGSNNLASGIVALLGTATGGTPYTAIHQRTDYPTFTNAAQAAAYFGGGDLVEAANIALSPSNDPSIQGGAQQVVCLNVAQSTQATGYLAAGAAQGLAITNIAYGPGGNATSVQVSAGSLYGVLLLINGVNAAGLAVSEVWDNLGGSPNASFATISTTGSQTAKWDASGNFAIYQGSTVVASVAATQTVAQLQAACLGAGLVFAYTDATQQGLLLAQLDHPTGTLTLSGAGLGLSAKAYYLAQYISNNSALVDIAQLPAATGLPAANNATVYLGGGSQQVPTMSDWQAALNLLEAIDVNTVVCLTESQAVSLAADAHCQYMCGNGQSERDCKVGLANPSLSGLATLSQIATQTLAINSRHTTCVAQAMTRYNSAGVLTQFSPKFTAVAVAGMQAGLDISGALTNKQLNALGMLQDASWSPLLNANQLLQMGLLFFQQRDATGITCVRDITSYQTDNNLARSEASMNRRLDYTAHSVRLRVQYFIGTPNYGGSSNALAGVIKDELETLQARDVLVSFATPVITRVADQAQVALQVALETPDNFIPIVLNVVSPALLAAS